MRCDALSLGQGKSVHGLTLVGASVSGAATLAFRLHLTLTALRISSSSDAM